MAGQRAADHTAASSAAARPESRPRVNVAQACRPMTQSVSPSDANPLRIDVFRDRLEAGVEHHVAQIHGDERIVATLRLDPVRSAPLRTMARIGVSVLPEAEGAYATLVAEADAAGHAGLELATLAALAARRRDADDTFWLAACPAALVQRATALGWRLLPRAADAPAQQAVPAVLLLDDVEYFSLICSPLAAIPPRSTAPAVPPQVLRDAFGLPAPEGAAVRAGAAR
jgi:hypothetical protein